MDYEQDYIMRMIKDMTRMIAKLLLGKEAPQYMLPDAQPDDKGLDGDSGSFYRRLIQMADAGEINEAENLLTDYLDQGSGSKEELEVALGFYVYINEMSNDFLDEHEYSREEIYQGLESLSTQFGVSGLTIRMPGV